MTENLEPTLWEYLIQRFPTAIRVREHRAFDWKNSSYMPMGSERVLFTVLEHIEELEVMRVAHEFYASRNWEILTSSTGGLRVRPNAEFGEHLRVLATIATTTMILTVEY